MSAHISADYETDDWEDFLETIRDGYCHLHALEKQLEAISDQAWHGPEAEALRKEYARAFADVMSREAFIEHCRREGETVPKFERNKGTA